ncbi:hypothetical protein HanXRQr2_Chr03g0138301 [Helianthus annuus]|uniref:Uncharacterized protein n=1 Tax=Helianthus annuus TaxID=4232 RepID=A0A9K3NY16_HELAN|nr:hypothetical protein HanXRQr2_Chr03g0138301 [Helianthus annuus]KAJ0946046.1 hypothetical protein HanPSC8_Chr03g0134871 [Helianthus annuus]
MLRTEKSKKKKKLTFVGAMWHPRIGKHLSSRPYPQISYNYYSWPCFMSI